MTMKLSIIVPMYNVEKYIEQCLQSLVDQTLTDFEVLVVNDGSQDDGPRIAERMALHHPFIKVLHKENGGLSDARNYGIDYALGDYVTFLDSDDYVEPTLYEKMVQKMNEGYDIVISDIEYFYEDKKPSWVLQGITPWEIEDIQKRALLSPLFAWNKVYRRELFKDKKVRYPLGTWYEDLPVTTLLFTKTERIGMVAEPLIHYRQRKDSIMGQKNSRRINEIFSVMELVRENFEKEGVSEKYKDELEYLHIEHLCLYGMFRFMRSDYFEELYKKAMETMKKHYPKWKKNPYIKHCGIKNELFLKGLNSITKGILKSIVEE